MRVRDIFLQCQETTGVADEATNFDRISDAVETLANKGLIDTLQGYLEIPTVDGRLVTLPRDVEVPVKVNVGDNPAFSRTKLYEFTMNGPGNNYQPTDWSWEDRGETPVSQQPTDLSQITFLSNVADDGKQITITGRIDDNNEEVTETVTLSSLDATSSNYYRVITHVFKPVTLFSVTLMKVGGNTDNQVLSIYAPSETEPMYRQIRLSQPGQTAHILFRRSVYRISSQDDWIPVQSRMGLYLMLRANEFYRLATPPDIQTAGMLEKQAEKFVQEEQKSRNVFAEVASQTESDSAYGLNINNRDAIIVADIYDDACQICGPVGQETVFDRITDAVEMLSNKGQWEGAGLEGYVDISCIDESEITLPRYVDHVIAMNIGNTPSKVRNRWFEFHLNGPGSSCSQSCRSWTDMGDVVTLADLEEAQGLIYKPDRALDNDKTITVYGYDENDQWIVDGITIAANSGATFSDRSSQTIGRIERIVRQPTVGFAQLIAFDSTGTEETQLGYYYPDETSPNYKRIKVPCSASWVRMRYKKRTLKVSSLNDQLHLRSRMAILAALRSIQAMRAEKPDFQAAMEFSKQAVQLLREEKDARNPAGTWNLSFDTSTSMSSSEHAQY